MGDLYSRNKDLVLVIGTVLILLILFSPIPPALLDLAIIVNFGFGLTIMLLTFYVRKPVEFSTFPVAAAGRDALSSLAQCRGHAPDPDRRRRGRGDRIHRRAMRCRAIS